MLTTVVFSVAGMVRGTFPFGSASRSTNDLGTQYVPFYTHLWDVLHGKAQGDLFFNWQSGFGVGFWADYGVGLGNPLSLLVAVFPRDRVDLAVLVITVAKLALAAAAMAAYLVRMRPGPRWLAVLLGASYGLCGWAIDDAAYVPMWLDGLIALPLFCLVGEWSIKRRRPLLGVAVIALFWMSNFYTAYMATIAAVLVLLARILTSDLRWSVRLRAVLRHGVTVVLGIAASAPILLPVVKANELAVPSPAGIFTPVPVETLLARFIPLTEGVGRGASLYVGTAALVLALSLPFNRGVSTRTRIVWPLLAVALGASFLWGPTHAVWHGFDSPNGSQYRQAFALCAVVIILAWISAADRPPDWSALAASAILLTALGLYTRDHRFLTSHSLHLLALSAGAVAVAMLVLRRLRYHRGLALFTGIGLIVVVTAELTWSAVVVDDRRSDILSASASPWGERQQALRASITAVDGWPTHRTDPGTSTTPNDPMLLGGQGPGYYSSLLPDTLKHTLTDLGFGWSGYGRALYSMDNPVTNAIFSIGAGLDRASTTARTDVPSLVTVRPGPIPEKPAEPTAYALQERLLGAQVYDVPKFSATEGTRGTHLVSANCRPGSTVYLHLPEAWGAARHAAGEWRPLTAARRPGINTSSAMVELGEVPASGSVTVEVRFKSENAVLPQGALGCLDADRLRKRVAELRANDGVAVQAGGHSIEAILRPDSTGTVVIGTGHLPGWRCSTDDGERKKPTNYGGLLAVELPGPTQKVSCNYRPPGLELGLATGGGALLATLALALASRTRRDAYGATRTNDTGTHT
ncbi:YfhO family protein [Kribbella sp. CA-247076]|uniref:YfhO family protein n=1 Tax=Kribbella sp. CA-247076 TaxID=3239941 RepID=UPI003D8A9C63